MNREHDPIMITVKNLHKHFKVFKHHRGALGALRNLFTREYAWVNAVDGISFDIGAGELVGYIGPNGAGKSTTIKMLSGLLVPSSGELRVTGPRALENRAVRMSPISARSLDSGRPCGGTCRSSNPSICCSIFTGFHADVYRQNLAEFRALLELDPFLDTPVRSLSLGQRMRADICAALIHNPPLVFLDEPTIGLDVVAKARIRQFIQTVNQERGTTFILTTHDLSDVEKLCRRVMIIDHGKLLYDGALDILRDRFSAHRALVVEMAEPYPEVGIEGAQVIARQDAHVTYQFDRNAITASALIGRLSARYRIIDLTVTEPAIEDTIRRIYEERLLEQ